MLQNNPRNVILCIMEVSRLATRFGVEPPGLVKFEREIAEEEESQHDSGLSHDSISSWQLRESPNPNSKSQRLCGLVFHSVRLWIICSSKNRNRVIALYFCR